MATATGVTVTCERATNEGLFTISPQEAFERLEGSIEKLDKPVMYIAELVWVIEGVPMRCPTCFEILKKDYQYCPSCGDETEVSEYHKSFKMAKKSIFYDMGVIEKVTFWARTKPEAIKDFRLKG